MELASTPTQQDPLEKTDLITWLSIQPRMAQELNSLSLQGYFFPDLCLFTSSLLVHQVGFMHPKCEMLQEDPIHRGQGHGATPARLKSAIFTSDIAIFPLIDQKKKKKNSSLQPYPPPAILSFQKHMWVTTLWLPHMKPPGNKTGLS